MASPALSEIQSQWQKTVDILETERAHFDGTLVADIDTLQQAYEGDYTPQGLEAWVRDVRGFASSIVHRNSARKAMIPLVYEMGKLIGSPYRDPRLIWSDIYDYYHANSLAVKSRSISYDTPAAGSNTGNGTVQRLTVDENGYNLEAEFIELKTLECIRDQVTGANRHAEIFRLYGVEPAIDGLDLANAGSGRVSGGFYAKHAGSGEGGSLLLNSSFTTYVSGGSVTTLYRGWTIAGSTSNIGTDTTNYYRGHPGDGDAPRSIVFNDNETITQKLSVSGRRIDPTKPYYLRVMFNRAVGSCDGTLTIALGSVTANVVLSAQTGWNELKIAIGTGNWPANFYEDQLDVSIALSGRSSGTLLVDDAILTQFDQWDGTYFINLGGSTPYERGDVHTWTDTGGAAADAKIQYYAWLAGFGYMPSASAASDITFADP